MRVFLFLMVFLLVGCSVAESVVPAYPTPIVNNFILANSEIPDRFDKDILRSLPEMPNEREYGIRSITLSYKELDRRVELREAHLEDPDMGAYCYIVRVEYDSDGTYRIFDNLYGLLVYGEDGVWQDSKWTGTWEMTGPFLDDEDEEADSLGMVCDYD